MSEVGLKWIDGHMMLGADSNGTSIIMSNWERENGTWRGLKPSDLLLLSAAACSTYDVVEILKKQREPLEALEVVCNGEQQPEPPYAFTKIHLHYIAKGKVDEKKFLKAIVLSEEKYCSVINTLRGGSAEITHSTEIIES